VAVSLAAIAGNVVLSVSLVAIMGLRGLALATAIAALGHGGLLVLLLHRRLGGIDAERLATGLAKILAAAALMAVAAWGIEYALTGLLPGQQILRRGIRLAAAIGGGLAVLAGGARLLRVRELDDALRVVGARLSRNRGPSM
jgi:putative peptidoglycan lipid II flippase